MRTVTLQDYKRRLLRVLVHIQQHLDDALGLEELAGLACFSPYHFHRLFKGMVGESVKEHIRRLRLERAASQLKLGTPRSRALPWTRDTRAMRPLRALSGRPLAHRPLNFVRPTSARLAPLPPPGCITGTASRRAISKPFNLEASA